jgi:hypothetical protein
MPNVPYCATVTSKVPFIYIFGGTNREIDLNPGTVIKVLQEGSPQFLARAKTPDGCRDGKIPAAGFCNPLPDCSTFQCN